MGITTSDSPISFVSDAAYGAGWNGVTTIAPSKNAVYDKIELLDGLVVHKAGPEDITGQKTFSLDIILADTKGLTWASGSSLNDNSGTLTMTTPAGSDMQIDGGNSVNINANSGDVNLSGTAVVLTGSVNLSSLTANRAIVLNASKNIVVSATTDTELGYVSGVTSAIQTQLNARQPLDSDLTSWAGVTRSSGFDTFTATPSSVNLKSLVTDETGSGALVFADTPTLVTPVIGAATGTSIVLTSTVTASSDADSTHTLGRSVISSPTTDQATFSHFDNATTTNYCVRQTSAGQSIFNAASGANLSLRINNVAVVTVTSTEVTLAKGLMLPTGTTTLAPLNIAPGVAPSSPVDGDIYYINTNDRLMFFKNATACEILSASAVNSVSPTSPNRTIQITISGTTFYIAAKTTND